MPVVTVRPLTSEIVIACTSRSRYFDLDAVRTEHKSDDMGGGGYQTRVGTLGGRDKRNSPSNPLGAPPLDHWWHDDHTGPYPPPAERNPMSHATWHIGDALTVLRTLPTASVDLILTSPPFLALRSYLPADHPDKQHEMGSEATPGMFLDALLDVVVECRRVLAPHGSLCVELGDTYAGSGGAGGDYNVDGWRENQPGFAGSGLKNRGRKRAELGIEPPDRITRGTGWPLDKSLTLIPETFRFALAYGRNPHTGRLLEPWRVRNVVRWCRPNPPVGALGDKVRPATSDIAIACTSRSRYFDLDAVREPHQQARAKPVSAKAAAGGVDARNRGGYRNEGEYVKTNEAGAPPLDHWWHNPDDDTFGQDAWHIPTHPYPGAHYATWPPDLCIKPILAMCPQRVCTTCGRPSERIVGEAEYVDSATRGTGVLAMRGGKRKAEGVNQWKAEQANASVVRTAPTLGWSDCGHNTWRNGHVLDPFAGSGTTGVVATGHGRHFTGIDLDPRNYDLARERIGMWLELYDTNHMIDVPTKGLI